MSYLPLSHMAAQTTDMYLPITYGGTVHFAQPDCLKVSYLLEKFGSVAFFPPQALIVLSSGCLCMNRSLGTRLTRVKLIRLSIEGVHIMSLHSYAVILHEQSNQNVACFQIELSLVQHPNSKEIFLYCTTIPSYSSSLTLNCEFVAYRIEIFCYHSKHSLLLI